MRSHLTALRGGSPSGVDVLHGRERHQVRDLLIAVIRDPFGRGCPAQECKLVAGNRSTVASIERDAHEGDSASSEAVHLRIVDGMHEALRVLFVHCTERMTEFMEEDCERSMPLALANHARPIVLTQLGEAAIDRVVLVEATRCAQHDVLAQERRDAQLVERIRLARECADHSDDDVHVGGWVVVAERRECRFWVVGITRPRLHAIHLDLDAKGGPEDAVGVVDQIGDLLRRVDGLREVPPVGSDTDPEHALARVDRAAAVPGRDVRRLRRGRGVLLRPLRLAPTRVVAGQGSEEGGQEEGRTDRPSSIRDPPVT